MKRMHLEEGNRKKCRERGGKARPGDGIDGIERNVKSEQVRFKQGRPPMSFEPQEVRPPWAPKYRRARGMASLVSHNPGLARRDPAPSLSS